jgi:hypothetical protein
MPLKRILIYHIGSLGDTIVAVPAFSAVRSAYPDARITLLTDRQRSMRTVQSREVFEGSGLVDSYLLYPVDGTRRGRILRPFAIAGMLARIRLGRFDALVYLVRTEAGNPRIERDRRLFRLAGIRTIWGMEGMTAIPPKVPGQPLPRLACMTDQLLARMGASGFALPPAETGLRALGIGGPEARAVEEWLAGRPPDGGRRWVGVGIGGKQPVNRWPLDRYRELVRRLIEQFDVWPVVFGGPEDRGGADELLRCWQRGYAAAGRLSVRAGISALSRCSLFIGNDTGTIHMAAAAGVPCIGIYSARNYPGEWDPAGTGHCVLQSAAACGGCRFVECAENGMKCLLAVTVDDVLRAAGERLVPRWVAPAGRDASHA